MVVARLAGDLAIRASQSPRAQYELGRTYIIYSHYDPASPFTKLAYLPLEKAAALPNSSILPEQALIFMNARMGLPIKDAWWESLIAKLKAHKPGVQDESSLGTLVQCARDHRCDLPKNRMMEANMAALSHPNPSARLLAVYGDEVRLTTRAVSIKGARGLRETSITRVADGATIAEVHTEWVWVRLPDGRPARVPDEIVRFFNLEDSPQTGAAPS